MNPPNPLEILMLSAVSLIASIYGILGAALLLSAFAAAR